MTSVTAGCLSSGIAGLDDVLAGGLVPGSMYLVEGSPGTGKTTLALQYLMAGAALGERVLYITLSETEEELRRSAASHGWDLAGVDIFELVPPEVLLDENQQQSLLYSSDLELGETTRRIFEAFERVAPKRLVIDSLSEIRLLAQSSLRYRRQILALKHYFARADTTVLMLDDLTGEANDRTVHSVAHAVLSLSESAPDYGAERRRLRISKYRGRRYRGGYHDFVIATGGLNVFPRLISAEHRSSFQRERVGTDLPALDALLGGGVERGSSTLIIGPAGTGKSLLTLAFVQAAIGRGERAALFVFDEEQRLLFDRARALGFDLEAHVAAGHLLFHSIDAAELSPGEFSAMVRASVTEFGACSVVIDSVNGFQSSMPHETALILHLRELLQFLNRQGVCSFVTVAQHGLVGDMRSPVDVTYLADTVILLRYFEAMGRVRRAISIIKKRGGAHEDTIREYMIEGPAGFRLGEPLTAFQGVLKGVPTVSMVDESDLMDDPMSGAG